MTAVRSLVLLALLWLFPLGAAVQQVTAPPNPVGRQAWLLTAVAADDLRLTVELVDGLEQWRNQLVTS